MSNKKEISPTLNECQNVTTTSIGTFYNKNISFDEYLYHASISRRLENRDQSNGNYTKSHSWIRRRLPHSSGHVDNDAALQSDQDNSSITQDERSLLARAQRNVAWGGIFYLITTDVFGPLTVPWALAQLGYVPGIVLYTILGALAAYGGYQLWVIFLHLDSYRYPIRSYGDLAYRVYGPWARHTVNVLQSLQLFFSVGILILANGQGISQLSSGTLCFVACCVIFTSAGFCVGQVRTLQRFQWLATISIVLNTMILIITMVIVTRSEPNYAGANAQTGVPFGPITTSIGLPATSTSSARIIGLLQAIYSYGGGMLYCDLMSEMKRPWDFLKALFLAQTFIFVVYQFYGIWTYTYQGQFALLISSQGISIYAWQSVTNVLNIISSLILACLYGNIGIKTAYVNIGVELLSLPPVNHGKGRFIFASLVPLYWGLAFIVCAAIPNISNFSALIAATTVLHFSYTFPAILMLGFRLKKDAILDNEHFDAQSGLVHHVDSGYRRWLRGVRKRLLLNSFDLVLFLGFIALCVLGMRASIDLLRQVFSLSPNTTSFSCKAPI